MSTQNSEKPQATVSARRRLLQIMAVGGTAAVVLPEKWVKPVVDAVIVPAHAATSVPISGIFGNHGTLAFADSGQGNFLERVAGMVVGSAHAASTVPFCGLEVTLNNVQNVVVDITFNILSNNLTNVIVDCYTSAAPGIAPVNTFSNVICNSLIFTSMSLTANTLSGTCVSSRQDCGSGLFTLYRKNANQCVTSSN
jgi:hypothetical protein